MKPLLVAIVILAVQGVVIALIGVDPFQGLLERLAAAIGAPYNTFIVLMGTSILGLSAGTIGVFAVLRRRSLVGDAVAHSALPGLALAYLILGERNFPAMMAGAAAFGLFGSLSISWLRKNTRVKADAAIGIVLSVLFGLGLMLSGIVQDDPTGRQAGLDSFLLGKTAGMIGRDLLSISLVAANVTLFIALFFKEFKLVSFDGSFASVQGFPALALDAAMMGLVVVTTVIGLPAVGVVLMAALLILPAVSARFWSDNLRVTVLLSGGIGLLTGFTGSWLSSRYDDLPAGAVIVLAGSALFLVSAMLAPRKGVLARLWKRSAATLEISRQHLLRAFFEIEESETAAPEKGVSVDRLLGCRSWSAWTIRLLLFRARLAGEIRRKESEAWYLTPTGREKAAEVVRRHRLWEIFLVEQASIAPDHVDRDADELEHLLTDEMLEALEKRHLGEGCGADTVPASVHPVEND